MHTDGFPSGLSVCMTAWATTLFVVATRIAYEQANASSSIFTAFTRSDHLTLDEIGKIYLKLYGECLDALLTGTQSDKKWLDGDD